MKNSLLVITFIYLFIFVACQSTYKNAVIEFDCPDPGSFYDKVTQKYYTVTTTGSHFPNGQFPIHESIDLAHWKHVGYVFIKDSYPVWARTNYWAPEIHIVGNKYHVYFTARDSTGRLSVGVAVSNGTILGPYYDPIGKALLRKDEVGTIDPTIMHIDSTPYLIWKDDGNDIGKPTPIWAAKLSLDGNSFSSDSKPIELLRNTLPWEGPLIEGPWHIYRAPYHYIFYSGNGYGSPEYAIGVARSKDPLGPYEKYGDPIMRSNDAFKGPGHCSVVSKDDKNQEFVMVYHSWIKDHILDPKYGRYMLIDRVRWTNDSWPYFTSSSPSVDPQPIP